MASGVREKQDRRGRKEFRNSNSQQYRGTHYVLMKWVTFKQQMCGVHSLDYRLFEFAKERFGLETEKESSRGGFSRCSPGGLCKSICRKSPQGEWRARPVLK